MNKVPSISVLIPVFNSEKSLVPCIWSVLNQSFEDFELLLYFDGCTDNSVQVVEKIKDPRVRKIESAQNRGIAHTRNELAQAAQGKYIAWLDADDFMLPDRLSQQFNYLEVHGDIFMVGSWVQIRNDAKVREVRWPASPDALKAWLLFRNPLVQSSLMMRRDKHLIFFDPEFEYLEDYHFYSRIFISKKIAIIPKTLTSYFQSPQPEMIRKYRHYDFVNKLETIMRKNFALLELNPGGNELALVREFLRHGHKMKPQDSQLLYSFFTSALVANKRLKMIDASTFNAIIYWQMLRLFKVSKGFHLPSFLYLARHLFTLFGAIRLKPKYR